MTTEPKPSGPYVVDTEANFHFATIIDTRTSTQVIHVWLGRDDDLPKTDTRRHAEVFAARLNAEAAERKPDHE